MRSVGGGAWRAVVVLAAAACVHADDVADDPVAQAAYIAPLAQEALLLDASRGGALIVVVGERGIALASRDDGQTWEQGEVPLRSTLTGVHMYDEQLGWAVGHDAAILRTRDGAKTWELLDYQPERRTPLLDVWFTDAERGFAIGAYGTFLATSDGGATWQAREFVAPPLAAGRAHTALEADAALEAGDSEEEEIWEDSEGPLDYHLNHLAPANDGRLYIAAEAGHLFRSDDAGATWSTLPSPYDGSFFGVLPLDADALLAVGLRGHIFRSDDGGLNWVAVESGTTATLTQGLRLQNDVVLVAGLAGTLLESRDGGAAFTLHERPDRLGTSTLMSVGADHLLLVGEGGVRRMTLEAALANAGAAD